MGKSYRLIISSVLVLLIGIIIWKRKKLKNMTLDTFHKFLGNTWDRHTDRRIGFLHPIIRDRVTAFINKADTEYGLKLRITSDGHFRSFEKQDELYSRGRTQAGRIVTNAKAGESYHNYGLAFDLVEIKNGQALWENPNWNKIGEIGKSFGFNWGGDWRSFKDYPHFELSKGYDLADLKWKYLNGDVRDGYVVV